MCLNVHQPNRCVKEKFMHPLKAWKIAGLPKPDDVVLAYLNYGQVPASFSASIINLPVLIE